MTLNDFQYSNIIHRCFRCGYCKFPVDWTDVNNCPPYARFRMESYSCGGRLWLTRAWLNEQINWSEYLAEILYSCTTCKNCEIKCPLRFNVDIVNMVVSARAEMVEAGKVPKAVKDFLQNIELYGNPYGASRTNRIAWTKGIEIDRYNGHEYLLYIGCAGSYDIRAQKSSKALAQILLKAGVSFGVLGDEETCDGNETHNLGEKGLFELLANKNIKTFNKMGVSKIITLSPHAFNAFKNYYPSYGGNFNVFHYTHILNSLLKTGRIKFSDSFHKKTVFHDPCFLGRWNGEYETPREILRVIPDIELMEMEKNRSGALCCGGGSGNFQMDLLGGSESSPARRRIREAYEMGAQIIAVSCPKCLIMLEDAIKAEGMDDKLSVMDISEIVAKACNI
ncbi:MAG TPA: (Fe-S)-binding protein [Syntrophorhabdaceae bacterium]|mgnify:CR=1 FL=1|nr:(Fe-S)-binding protein [Syntrophorhabdaceae bacterium]